MQDAYAQFHNQSDREILMAVALESRQHTSELKELKTRVGVQNGRLGKLEDRELIRDWIARASLFLIVVGVPVAVTVLIAVLKEGIV